jgi:GTP cyclohydrolase IB
MVFFHREKIYPQISQIPQIFLETASIYSSEAAFGDAADCSPGFQLIIVLLSRQAVARKPRSASVREALRRKMFEMDVRFLSAFTFEKPIYRPFGAGALLNRYLGLKPRLSPIAPSGQKPDAPGNSSLPHHVPSYPRPPKKICVICGICGYLTLIKRGNRMQPQTTATLVDTQSLPDHREVRIDRVGVTDVRFPIVVRDKAHSSQHTIARVALTVDLPHHFKGTHMSRFIEVLNEHGSVVHVDNIKEILRHLQQRLDAQQAHVEFEFPFFIEKRAPVTEAVGLMDYNVRFTATASRKESDFVVTVMVPVTTLCPCSKAISKYGAHNQRGQVTLSVRFDGLIWIEELIQLVESSASAELYSLLKRPDEKAVTERAYEHPVFVEDLVRNIAIKANADSRITWYRIEAENYESIHNHNAYAMIEKG